MNKATQPPEAALSHVGTLRDQWRQGKRPVCLKIDEHLEFEIKDDTTFQMLVELLDRLENIEAIQKGLDDFKAGRTVSLREFKQRVPGSNGIPDRIGSAGDVGR
jgi:hypothetical protein